jgi:pimeloyl-ACP methyl ester carboxylesterase
MKPSLLFALLVAASAPALAADAPAQTPNRFAATIAPAERFEVGSMLVERHGSGGRPLILIPGLASGAWVWQEAVREFAGQRAVYVVTLAGFDGRPPLQGDPIDGARTALRQLIASRKLDKPILIGHSLGGTLALALAQDAPSLVGGVVSVDGLPVFPGNEDTPPLLREQAAMRIRQQVAQASPRAFAAQQQNYMRTIGVLDMSRADALAELSAKSDPASVAQYIADVMALDLRPGLPRISAPVLVIAPYFEPDDVQANMTIDAKAAYYRSLLDGAPKVEVVAIAPSRHFVMIDQPRKLFDAIRRFISQP